MAKSYILFIYDRKDIIVDKEDEDAGTIDGVYLVDFIGDLYYTAKDVNEAKSYETRAEALKDMKHVTLQECKSVCVASFQVKITLLASGVKHY